jgi:hypothetical protein
MLWGSILVGPLYPRTALEGILTAKVSPSNGKNSLDSFSLSVVQRSYLLAVIIPVFLEMKVRQCAIFKFLLKGRFGRISRIVTARVDERSEGK